MIERPGPLILLSTLIVSQLKGHEQIPLTMVKPGENFTMTCSVNRSEAGLIYWYRMSFEPVIEAIAEGSYEKIKMLQKNNHRFSVTQVEKSLYSFNISNVTKEDEASYFCQAGSSYQMTFFNATFLMVIDQGNNSFHVDQISSASAPLGGSVQLKCSLLSKRNSSVPCPSKRSVHWFRSGSGKSPASTVYTYKDQTEEQDQRKCVYSLTTTLHNLDDTGTYYCAVATCGEILFGNGTRVEISCTVDLRLVCAALGVLLFCSAVIHVVMFCQYRKATHLKGVITTHNSTEVLDRDENPSNSPGDNVAGVNYVALDFPLRKVKRKTLKNTLPPECFYSTTRDYR